MAARLTAFVVSAIVVVTFVAGLIVGAQREDDGGPADLIVHNAHVYLGASVDAAEALAIRDGKIVRVGTNKDIDRLRRRQTLDAQGGTVVPGLNDAGLQLFPPAGLTAAAASASASTLASASSASSSSSSNSPGSGSSGSSSSASSSAPSSAAASSAADASAGAAELSRDQKLDALRRTITEAHHVGLTSVQTTISSAAAADDLALLAELRKRGELKLRVFVALTATLPLDEAAVEELNAIRKLVTAEDSGFVKVGAVNLALRATVETRGNGSTAAKPRTSGRKNSAEQVAQLADAITLLDRRQWQVILDTPTSADVALAVDAFDRAFGEQAASMIRLRRHRVELSAPVDATLTARIAALELVPSLPAAVLAQLAAAPRAASATSGAMGTAVTTASAMGGGATDAGDVPSIIPASATTATTSTAASQARASFAALLSNPRSILRSEFPTMTLAPLPVITAVLASAEDSAEAVANALDAYTSRAAYATHDEPLKGIVAKDQAADLVIFSADLFAASTERPVDPIVIATIVNGKVVFTQSAPKPVPTEQ
jgi:predicted amidohydrolase YtcJ